MISHIMVEMNDVERSMSFYKTALAALFVTSLPEIKAKDDGPLTTVGLGDETVQFFWPFFGLPRPADRQAIII